MQLLMTRQGSGWCALIPFHMYGNGSRNMHVCSAFMHACGLYVRKNSCLPKQNTYTYNTHAACMHTSMQVRIQLFNESTDQMCIVIAVLNTFPSVSSCILSPQASQSASAGVTEVKEAHITALQTELRGKNRVLQAMRKVGAGVSSTAPHVHTHMHNV